MAFLSENDPRVRNVSHQLPLLQNDQLLLFVFVPDSVPEHLLQLYMSWLSPAEQQRWRRFYFPQHRQEYLLSHALVRYVTSTYSECAPAEVIFEENQFGKPAITSAPWLSFNLSHSAGVSLLAIAWGGEVGVDIEKINVSRADLDVAQKYFSFVEYQQLQCHGPLMFAKTFFSFWTLKEAYIKARGQGLSLPLADFYFLLRDSELELHEQPYLRKMDAGWCGELLCLQDTYLYAWIWGRATPAVSVSSYWIVPQHSCFPLEAQHLATLSNSFQESVEMQK